MQFGDRLGSTRFGSRRSNRLSFYARTTLEKCSISVGAGRQTAVPLADDVPHDTPYFLVFFFLLLTPPPESSTRDYPVDTMLKLRKTVSNLHSRPVANGDLACRTGIKRVNFEAEWSHLAQPDSCSRIEARLMPRLSVRRAGERETHRDDTERAAKALGNWPVAAIAGPQTGS